MPSASVTRTSRRNKSYKRSYGYRKRYVGKRFGGRRFGRAISRIVRTYRSPQRKYLDFAYAITAATAVASYNQGIIPLPTTGNNLIPPTTTTAATNLGQGVGANQMIGYKGYWKGHLHRIALITGTTPCFIRVIHFLWKQSELTPGNATDVPTINVILQNTANIGTVSTTATGPQTFLSPYNLQWSKQYKILHDEIYSLSTAGHTQVTINKKKLALKASFKIDYVTDEQDEGQGMTGMIPYVMFISSQTTAANQPTVYYYSRLSYVNY